jgi:hypothetical protein
LWVAVVGGGSAVGLLVPKKRLATIKAEGGKVLKVQFSQPTGIPVFLVANIQSPEVQAKTVFDEYTREHMLSVKVPACATAAGKRCKLTVFWSRQSHGTFQQLLEYSLLVTVSGR